MKLLGPEALLQDGKPVPTGLLIPRSGRWYGPFGTNNNTAPGVGVLNLHPIFVPPCTIAALGVVLQALLAAATGHVSVYADDGAGMPIGAPLVPDQSFDGSTGALGRQLTLGVPLVVPRPIYLWGAYFSTGAALNLRTVLPSSYGTLPPLGLPDAQGLSSSAYAGLTGFSGLTAFPTIVGNEAWTYSAQVPMIKYKVA